MKEEMKKIRAELRKTLKSFCFHVLYDTTLIWVALNFVFIVFKSGIRVGYMQILAPYLLYVVLCVTLGLGGKE